MKKTLTLILALLCTAGLMIGCGQKSEEEKILEKIYEATTWENLLKNYGSLIVDYALPENASFHIYVDTETFLSTDDEHSFAILFSPEESCEVGFYEDGTTYFDRYINIFDENMSIIMRSDPLLPYLTDNEIVTSMTEENGVIYFETKWGTNSVSAEDLETAGLDMADGDFYISNCKADAETYRMLESYEYILRADGTETYMGTATFHVGVERPNDYIHELAAKGDEIDALPAEQTRVINLVVDPGTEDERTIFQKVMRGDRAILPYDLRGYEIYMDPEGKQRKPDVPDGDLLDVPSITYYLIKTE